MDAATPVSGSHPERSLNRQVVLEEEEYTEALSRIIARDFFPSLVHLDATNEYLDALQTRDPHLITASVRRLEQLTATPAGRQSMASQTPGRTPLGYTAETPLSHRSESGEPQRKRPRYDGNMSLDEFQARYTSEDNSSFLQILDEENRTRKERYGWAWEAQRKMEAQRDKMIEQREKMLIEAPAVTGVRGKFTIEAAKPAGLLTDGPASKQEEEASTADDDDGSKAIIVSTTADSSGQPADVMAPLKDTRPVGVDSWKFKARNSLMFTPDADVSPHDPPPATTDRAKNLKKVEYKSTRLSEQEHSVIDKPVSAPPSPTRSHVNAAITGQERASQESGFSLVPELPSPTPAELGSSALKQLMTWGTLNSTPRIISQTGDPIEPSTPFHIPQVTSREAIAHRLSNKAAKSLRVKAEMLTPRPGKTPNKGSMGPPSWTPRRPDTMVGNLTPAARRLLERTTIGTASSRKLEGSVRQDMGGKGVAPSRGPQ